MSSVNGVSLDGLVSGLYPASATSSATGATPSLSQGTDAVLGPAAEFIASTGSSTDLSGLFADAVSAQSADAQAVASLSSLDLSSATNPADMLSASDPNALINAGMTYTLMAQGGAWVAQTAAEVVGSKVNVTA